MTTRQAAFRVRHILLACALAAGTASAVRAQATEPGQPRREGVTVHGHWTIDVRNPDGTLARHVEFENALADDGAVLGRLLGRQGTVGRWMVMLYDRSDAPCKGGTWPTFTEYCVTSDPAGTGGVDGTNVFKNLVQTNTGVNDSRVVLKGSVTALSNGRIGEVSSHVGQCQASVPSSNCNTLFIALPFTQAILPTPVPVVQGQIIQVTVVISFS